MAAESPSPTDAVPFEATLAQLEELVARLESGDLPLDEALKTFEHGVRLTQLIDSVNRQGGGQAGSSEAAPEDGHVIDEG